VIEKKNPTIVKVMGNGLSLLFKENTNTHLSKLPRLCGCLEVVVVRVYGCVISLNLFLLNH